MLTRTEVLSAQNFDYLLSEFQGLDPESHERMYRVLTAAGQEKFIEAIRSAKDEFLIAFGILTEEPVLVMPALPRETSLSFSAIPESIEQVDKCFESFYQDPKFAEYTAGQSDKELFKLFKLARLAAGVAETSQSTSAIAQYAEAFNLSA
jgi:hypothetical protein